MEGRVTGITRQKKNRQRLNIFIDGDYGFSLCEKLAAAIHIGDVITPSEIEDLKKRDEKETAFVKALHYLKFRFRTGYEVKCYLEKKGFDDAAVSDVLHRLAVFGYVDDAAFARMWIEQRSLLRPRGQFGLHHELKSKGVPEEIIQSVLAGFEESDPAWRAVASRLDGWAQLDAFALKKKIYDHLKRRGFSFATCEEVYRKAVAWVQGKTDDDG